MNKKSKVLLILTGLLLISVFLLFSGNSKSTAIGSYNNFNEHLTYMDSDNTEYTDENKKVWNGFSSYISSELCDGCGVCSICCPFTDHENRSDKDVIKPLSNEREVRYDL